MNIKIFKSRGEGKTYSIIKNAIETACSDKENGTVILCPTRISMNYVYDMICDEWKHILLKSEKNGVSKPIIVTLKSNAEITINVCNKENLIRYLINDYNIFIDNIEFCNIVNLNQKFGFSSDVEKNVNIIKNLTLKDLIDEIKNRISVISIDIMAYIDKNRDDKIFIFPSKEKEIKVKFEP